MADDHATEHVDDRVSDLMGRQVGRGSAASTRRESGAAAAEASWGEGLDAATASARDLVELMQDVYSRRQHRDAPAALVRQIEDLAGKLTDEPRTEPAYGPGLWTDMPVHPIDTMAAARPMDLDGAPSDHEIDLMTTHAIRMGERLCRTYPDWSQTLPPCWIRHSYIVDEVYALACYQDLVASADGGGFYAPAMQQNIQSALMRIKEQMQAEGATKANHAHDMADDESRRRAADRMAEYHRWAGEAKASGWPRDGRVTRFDLRLTDIHWPRPLPDLAPVDDDTLRDQAATWSRSIESWRQTLDRLDSERRAYAAEHDPSEAEPAYETERDLLRADMERWIDGMEHDYAAWLRVERDARDDLDKASAEARIRLADRRDPLPAQRAGELRALKTRADMLLGENDDPGRPGPRPHPIREQTELAAAIRRITTMHDKGDPFARARTMIDRVNSILPAEGTGEDR